MKTPIGIIRRLDGPSAVLCSHKHVPPLKRTRSAAPALEDMDPEHEIIECPLARTEVRLFPQRDSILGAWQHLRESRKLDDVTTRAIALILRETSPDPGERVLLRDHGLVAGRRLTHNAWANLFDAHSLSLILNGGVRGTPNGMQDGLLTVPPLDVPDDFALRILPPLFRARDGRAHVRGFLAHYWRLELKTQTTLLAGVARLIASTTPEQSLAWLDVLTHQPAERREIFLTVLLETDAHRSNPPDWLIPRSNEFNELIKDELYAFRLQVILSPDGRACRPEYLMSGFRLSNRFAERFPFAYVDERGRGNASEFQAVFEVCEYVHREDAFYDEFALRLWERCAGRPGLTHIMARLNRRIFSPRTTLEFMSFFMNASTGIWDRVRESTAALLQITLDLAPEYRLKAIALFRCASDLCRGEFYTTRFDFFSSLIRRLCAPPMSRNCINLQPLMILTASLPAELRETPVLRNTNSLRALEKAGASNNRAPLTTRGLGVLTLRMPEFTLKCLEHFPARLVKSAELLGSFNHVTGQEMLMEFSRSPIMLNFENEGCLDLDRLRRWAYPNLFNPVPARLLGHFRGETTLTGRALENDLGRAHRDIALLRLEVLDEMIRKRLAMSVGAQSVQEFVLMGGDSEHSLRMLRSIDANIRTLKRFLRARARGHANAPAEHPANRAWLSARRSLPAKLWCEGLSLKKNLNDGRQVFLQVEQDPDEILKMGTYFDTCLGLGGCNAFSAAAVLLDINKQVVYARDAAGKPLGRQQVAISEEGRLVCFQVYTSPDLLESIRPLFEYYDLLFARRLGLPIHDNEDAPYEVRLLVAEEWYDDGAWVPREVIALT